MSNASDLLRRIQALQLQAQHAENRLGLKLRTAQYTSIRKLQKVDAAGKVEAFDAFAVSLPTTFPPSAPGGRTDVILCRNPELAKFVALLLSIGDEIIPLVESVLRSSLPPEGKGG